MAKLPSKFYRTAGPLLAGLTLLALACGSPAPTPIADRPAEDQPTALAESPDTPVAPTATTAIAPQTATAAPPNPAAPAPAETPPETPTAAANSGPAALVQPDPDYQAALNSARLRTAGWQTDFSRHTVPYSEFRSGGVPRDGIPPLDQPAHESIAAADRWLADPQPVVALAINGAARAYPLAILTWHEIANDTLGGVPVAVTFCPLCNSAVAFDRRLDGATLDFGVSGNLRHSDLVMWDRQTESWWQQLTGQGIVGDYAGYQLKMLPAQLVSWRDFKAAYPQGDALSRDTGHARDYGRNPYTGYDNPNQSPFLFEGQPDDRLPAMERVAALILDGQPLAFPFPILEQEKAVNYAANGRHIVVLFQPGAASALDQPRIADSRDVGSAAVFNADLNGQTLTFRPQESNSGHPADAGFVDQQTGSVWNVLGQAIAGPLTGQSLTPIVHASHFWFAWAAFAPQTQIYGEE